MAFILKILHENQFASLCLDVLITGKVKNLLDMS